MGFRNSIAKLEFMPRQHELDEECAQSVTYVSECKAVIAKYRILKRRQLTDLIYKVLWAVISAKKGLFTLILPQRQEKAVNCQQNENAEKVVGLRTEISERSSLLYAEN